MLKWKGVCTFLIASTSLKIIWRKLVLQRKWVGKGSSVSSISKGHLQGLSSIIAGRNIWWVFSPFHYWTSQGNFVCLVAKISMQAAQEIIMQETNMASATKKHLLMSITRTSTHWCYCCSFVTWHFHLSETNMIHFTLTGSVRGSLNRSLTL